MSLVVAMACPAPAQDSDRDPTVVVGGTGWGLGIVRVLAEAYRREHPEITLSIPPSVGTAGGLRALEAGVFDLALTGRPLKPEEEAGGLSALPLLRSPMVFATSLAPPPDQGLARRELPGIYDRTRRTWPDGTLIRLVLRNERDSWTILMKQVLPELATSLEQATTARGAVIAFSDQEAMDLGQSMPGSLLVNALVALRAERRNLSVLPLDGVAPSPATLADGSYPFGLTLFCVGSPRTSQAAIDFRTFMMAPVNRDTLLSLGALPIAEDGRDRPTPIP